MTNLIERIPPQSIEAEQASLGAMLLEREAIAVAVGILRRDDFYREAHRVIYDGIIFLFDKNEPVDLVTISEWLRTRNKLDEVGGAMYLADIMSKAPTAAAIEYYAKIVRDRSLQRMLIRAADEIMTSAYQTDRDIDELVDASEQKIFSIAERGVSSGFERLYELVKQEYNTIDESQLTGSSTSGISSGFIDLDSMTAGFRGGELIILAARPSMGKTAFALNLARNICAGEKKTVAVFSIEMSKEQLAKRLLCSEARVQQDVIMHGMASNEDMQKLGAAVETLFDYPMYIDDTPAMSVLEMRGKARRLKAEHGLGLIVVDYLQLMHSASAERKAENRVQEVSQISRGLKALGRELQVPVIALSQLSRSVEARVPRRPQLSDLRESGAIEQDADVVMFLYRPNYYGEEEVRKAGYDPEKDAHITELSIAKQRNGPTGSIKLVWKADMGLFGNLTDKY